MADFDIADFIAAVVMRDIKKVRGGFVSCHSVSDLRREILDQYKITLPEAVLLEVYQRLLGVGAATIISNPYAADHFIIDEQNSDASFDELSRQAGTNAYAVQRLGEDWIEEVISNLAFQEFRELQSEENMIALDEGLVPASDRVVTLGHNQISEIEDEADKFFEVLNSEWNEPNEPDETSLAVGKVKAGLELIRAAIFEAELFKMSMIAGLNLLIEKYKDHAISAAASSLLNLILKEVGLA